MKKRNEGIQLKFLKQNFLTLIVLIVVLISIYKLNNLQVRYNELNSQYYMLQSSIQNISNNQNSYQPQSQQKEAKEIMSPLDLAEYLDIDMMLVYDMVKRDTTMPYIEINGEYRFNKAAIEKWMETRKIILTK
jgi:excisionase family DNA binding protein